MSEISANLVFVRQTVCLRLLKLLIRLGVIQYPKNDILYFASRFSSERRED